MGYGEMRVIRIDRHTKIEIFNLDMYLFEWGYYKENNLYNSYRSSVNH